MSEFGSNRAAWLIAGFLGRKFMKDLLGRWSVIPVLAVAACLWNKWRARQVEGKLEQGKLEEVRRSTRRQLQLLRKKSVAGAPPPPPAPTAAGGWALRQHQQQQQQRRRRPGERLGGIPSGSPSTTPDQQQAQRQHISPTAAAAAAAAIGNGGTSRSGSGSSSVAAAPKDALASELWAWLGGVGTGRSCSADRPQRSSSSQRSGGGGAGGGGGGREGGGGGGGGSEWRGAFHNRMGNLPRRNAFKTARGKVYLRGGRKGAGGSARGGARAPPPGGLASVREEDEGVAIVNT